MTAEPDGADVESGPVGTAAPCEARPRWVFPAAIALTVALVCALVATVWFGIKAVHGFSEERGRANAVEAAREMATSLTNYDSGTADADTARILADSTPQYGQGLSGDQNSVVKKLHEIQAHSSGTVTEAGILSYDADTDTAHVLVTVRAQVATKAVPAGQARDYRLDLTMVDQGHWLVNAMDFVS